MALTSGTLPGGTTYPTTVQALLDLFASYLSAPGGNPGDGGSGVGAGGSGGAVVQSTMPTSEPVGTLWFNPTTGVVEVYATIPPATSPTWQAPTIPVGSITAAMIANGTITSAQLGADLLTLLGATTSGTTAIGLEEWFGGGSREANFFIMSDGSLTVTGAGNSDGKNGYGVRSGSDNASLPTRCGFSPVLGSSTVAKVYTNQAVTMVLTNDGKVYVAGMNTNGQLGLGDTTNRFVFTQIPQTAFSSNPVTALAMGGGAGNFVSCYALDNTGKVYAWGANHFGQLGLGSTTAETVPTLVTGLSTLLKSDGITPNPIVSVSATNAGPASTSVPTTVYVITQEGSVYAAGWNAYGQLGLGTTTPGDNFVLVPSLVNLTAIPPLTVTQIALASNYVTYCTAIFLMSDGTVRSVGSGTHGQLGNNTTSDSHTVVDVYLDTSSTVLGSTGPTITKLVAYQSVAYAVGNDGTLFGWGYNADGNFGTGDTTHRTIATVLSPINVTDVAIGGNFNNVSCVVTKTDGTLWAAGNNQFGQLGIGNVTTTVEAFTQVLLDSTAVAQVRFGSNNDVAANGTCALLVRLTSGKVLACGWDAAGVGQLGVSASPAPASVLSTVNF